MSHPAMETCFDKAMSQQLFNSSKYSDYTSKLELKTNFLLKISDAF